MSSNKIAVTEVSNIKPDTMFRFKHNGHAYLLANINNTIYAIDDLCTHEDASLYNGALKGDCVECPLHSSHFSFITGLPQQAPATEPVKTYSCNVSGDIIYMDLLPNR